MKAIVIFILIIFLSGSLYSQYSKVIVQLTNKGNNSYSLKEPSRYLSARAIERRTRQKILVDSSDIPVSPAYINSIAALENVRVLSTSKWLNQVLIETTDQVALNKVKALPFVKAAKGIGNRIMPNRPGRFREHPISSTNTSVSRTTKTATDNYNYGSNYNQVHMHEGEFLHNKGFHGESIQIAVLDAGFSQYKTITAFDSLRLNNQVLGEQDFVAFDNSVNEDDAHGMFCLSILAANWPGRMVGTAPKAKYWLIRTENAASEFPIEEHNWVAGAEFADSAGADVISSSLGYTNFDDASFNHTYADLYKNNTWVSQGAAMAVRKGMIVSNSAGNEGNNNWKYIAFPADADSVCTVGAVNASGSIATFSSYGYPGKVKPGIVSMGVATVIAGFNNQPVSGSGTSFSNPNIAGLIACLWQAFPSANNMKILDAVYKSADRYTNPDNRYGFGIPNFKRAYQILKHDENNLLYGSEWLFATPNPFANVIDVKFIGRIDGNAKLELLGPTGQVVVSQNFITEKEEIYPFTFTSLSALPAGDYIVRYSDSLSIKTLTVTKNGFKDWITSTSNPFNNTLEVYLKAPETGDAAIRLIDIKGRVIETVSLQVTQNEVRTIRFNNATKLARGTYFLQYISKKHKRTISLIKA